MSKILGIDYGEAKIGLALAEAGTKVAVPWKVFSQKDLLKKIKEIVEAEDIGKIVVGLPLSLKGSETKQTQKVRDFIQRLRDSVKIEIITEDERLTTVQAQKQGGDDSLAASYILQTYLDRYYG
ncbi:Holliday junction resolvase RuvX [Patescibacteria group bacterium]|nr:Holliday junction resolvase RuvX [Patescibacteria group bacterium]